MSPRGPEAPRLVERVEDLHGLLRDIDGAGRVAVDIESNGMFAYAPRVCTVQVGWVDSGGDAQVAIVDTLVCPVQELAALLQRREVMKVVHDLAFDARVLHLEGVDLCAVRDTSVAATYLGKPATGLANLLSSELDVQVGKEMQNSDWARRPLSCESLSYLAGDVVHLLDLDARLHEEVREAGIADEVATETAYRLVDALQIESDERPPHLRIRGNERLDGRGRRVLERIAAWREALAKDQDLPPQRIVGDKLLLAIADRRPRSMRDLLRFRAVKRLGEPDRERLLQHIRSAVEKGPASTPAPPPPSRPTHAELTLRKRVEKQLQDFRRAEAERRGVHEQVVLPSHCLRRLARHRLADIEAIANMPGLGRARAKRYANLLLKIIERG